MWGALLGGLVSGGLGYLGSKKQSEAANEVAFYQLILNKKAQDAYNQGYDELIDDILGDPSGYAGTRVEGVPYVPTSLDVSLADVIAANTGNFGGIAEMIRSANRETTANDMRRLEAMIPGGSQTLAQGGKAAYSMMRGEIPQDVQDAIMSARAEQTGQMGTPGGFGPAYNKDLGITSLDLMQQGTSMFGQITNMAEQLSPVNRQMATGQMFFQPSAGAALNLEQAQLGQQSGQNIANLAATPDPAKVMESQLRGVKLNTTAAMASGAAAAYNPAIPPYAQIYGQIGNTIGNAVNAAFSGGGAASSGAFSSPSGGFGNYQSPQAYNDYARYYNSAYPNAAPKAYVVI